LAEICEICGNSIRGLVNTVQVDNGLLRVCTPCSKLGKLVKMPKDPQPPQPINSSLKTATKSDSPSFEKLYNEPELDLHEEFYKIIRNAREKMGLSQEEFGRKINEKLSVIKHIETGKLKPDVMLTRKLERTLKIKIMVPVEE